MLPLLRPSPEPALADDIRPLIVALDDERARDARLAGAKAANLARAATRALPVLPGFAITTEATREGELDDRAAQSLREAWDRLSEGGAVSLVVRSSSTIEDTSTSSMAGQFTSLLDVDGWPAFLDAVAKVLASAAHPQDQQTRSQPMAVLVQTQLDAVCGGVLFGVDPVTGDRHHLVVEAVPGTPESLVSGSALADHCVLTRRGRVVGRLPSPHQALLTPSRRRRLARLAAAAARAFDGPQDLEWAFDAVERLWLLQSRAVTAVASEGPTSGPILGPGPVAETFPEPLRRLEEEIWVEPLAQGVIGALQTTGAVARSKVDRSPVVTTVGGWVAADLELFGIAPRRHRGWQILNPARGARRVLSAWRVGRLRAALPALAGDLLSTVDADLRAVGDLRELTTAELLDLLDQIGLELVSLHGHEVLAGMLLGGEGDRSSVAASALAAVRRGRAMGLSDEQLVSREPVVLALVAPSIGGALDLPDVGDGSPGTAAGREIGWREALRLRCRWAQELGARLALELGDRLVEAGLLDDARLVRELGVAELRAAALDGSVPEDLAARPLVLAGPPLPVAFRLDAEGSPRAVAIRGRSTTGLPASAGRASGEVCHRVEDITPDHRSVLVVATLDPRLAAALPRIAGLVSETGSALSHLAILAREYEVPAVVAVPAARSRFPAGSRVIVDGSAGEVHPLDRAGPGEEAEP